MFWQCQKANVLIISVLSVLINFSHIKLIFSISQSTTSSLNCRITHTDELNSSAELCTISINSVNYTYFQAERYCTDLCSTKYSGKGFLCPRLPEPNEVTYDLGPGSTIFLDSYVSILVNESCLVQSYGSQVMQRNCSSARVNQIICVSNNFYWDDRNTNKSEKQPVDLMARSKHHSKIVEKVNSMNNSTWKASLNPSVILDDLPKKGLLTPGALRMIEEYMIYDGRTSRIVPMSGNWSSEQVNQQSLLVAGVTKIMASTSNYFEGPDYDSIPVEFDARLKWPKCTQLSLPTTNQGACGSCFAVSAVAAISDRICVFSNQTVDKILSATEFLSCNKLGYRCNTGGESVEVFKFWRDHGLITGGGYGSGLGCWPYDYPSSCGKPCPLRTYKAAKSAECRTTCVNTSSESFEHDRYFAKNVYSIVDPKDPESRRLAELNMQWEIMTRGPVVSSFLVAEDFLHYKKGVYQHRTGELTYGHAVRMIGWGVEDGVPYWLVANSWGEDWGDKGFFKILRGSNHLLIELRVIAGTPQFD